MPAGDLTLHLAPYLHELTAFPRGQVDSTAQMLDRFKRAGSGPSSNARIWYLYKELAEQARTQTPKPAPAAVLRKSDPMPPSPPALDTAAASSADVQVPIGARIIGTSIPNRSQRAVSSIVSPPGRWLAREHLPVKLALPIGLLARQLRIKVKAGVPSSATST